MTFCFNHNIKFYVFQGTILLYDSECARVSVKAKGMGMPYLTNGTNIRVLSYASNKILIKRNVPTYVSVAIDHVYLGLNANFLR